MYYNEYVTPVGMLCIAEEGGALVSVNITRDTDQGMPDGTKKETPLLRQAAAQLAEYFAGKRTQFALPLAPQGTAFQKKVWDALCAIPYGETRSYQEIAAQIGNAKACRAVGGANNRNPLMILIPCHRVIGRDGSLVGYGGGLWVKQYLLELERNN